MAAEEDLAAFLRSAQHGCLATADAAGRPYVVPVNFLFRGQRIYIHGAQSGRKLENIAARPEVAFCAYEQLRIVTGEAACRCATRYISVLVEGRAELVPDGERKQALLAALTAKYAEAPVDPPAAAECLGTALIEIVPERITGKRNVEE
jgi:hypothetical protein